jgi:O-antigen/teichoic acid export membrane protein
MKKKQTLGGDVVKLTLSKVITAAISMGCTMLLSRFRTLDEYGTYSQLLLVINLASSLLMLGLPNSINYFLARADTQEERQKFLSVYYTFSTVLSLLVGGVLVCSVSLIAKYFDNAAIRSFLYFLALYPWGNIIASSVENLLVVYHRTDLIIWYRLANSCCLLGIILLVQVLNWDFQAYMVLLLGVYVFFAVVVYILAARLSGRLRISFDRKMLHSILVFSIPMGLATVVGTLDIEIDKLLIGRMMDTEQLAIYTNASKELPVTMIASALTAVLLPSMIRMLKDGEKRKAVALWGVATELSFTVICLISAGVITYASDVMMLLYSEKYLAGIPVFCVYALVLLLRCTYFGMVLNASGKTKSVFYCSLASLGLNIVLNPLFYWLFGMIGPAIATFLSMLVVLIAQLVLTARIVELPFREIFPWKSLGKILLINIAFAGCFWGIKAVLPIETLLGSLGESLLLGAVWSAVYFLILRRPIKQAWRKLNGGGEDT